MARIQKISYQLSVSGWLLLPLICCSIASASKDDSKKEVIERLLDLLGDKKEVGESRRSSHNLDLNTRQSRDSACSGRPRTITETAGTIQSPGYPRAYPDNALCQWRIISQKTKAKIKITFTGTFGIEEANNCVYDYVEVYDGSSPRATKLGRFCGSDLPTELVTEGNTAFIVFKSDYSAEEEGFHLKYEIQEDPGECNGQVRELTGDGTLTSPRYPQNYTNNLNCKWRIKVEASKRVKLTFEDFDVEDEMDCPYDYLNIYDGTDASAQPLGKYCGTQVPKDIITSANVAFVLFKTDDSVRRKGFKIGFRAVNAPTQPSTGGAGATTNTTVAQIDLDCDFEQGNMCLWSRAAGGNINWKLRRASRNTYLIGEGGKWGDKDHTTNTSAGHYICIDGSETAEPGYRGYLISPELTPGPPDGRCLQLWYNMFYTKGVLQVVMRREDVSDEVIWQRNGDQGNGWHKGRIALITSTPYRLVLVGSRGTSEKETGIAVDDIQFDNTPCAPVSLNCGQRRQKRSLLDDLLQGSKQRRILGGETSSKGMWPWIASIRTSISGVDGVLRCGGSLIDRRWVLTAAHCFERSGNWITNPGNIDLHLGEHNVGQDSWDDSQIVVKPEKVIIHPQRARSSIGQVAPYDIALVKLPHDVTLSEDVNVVCLPLANDTWSRGTTCSVSGWGRTESDTAGSDLLMHVDLDLVINRVCSSYFGMQITNDLLCAKHGTEIKSSCRGDSGGPLVCKKDDRYILLGVVSWGVPCNLHDQSLPSVFSSVTYYLPWIESTINSED